MTEEEKKQTKAPVLSWAKKAEANVNKNAGANPNKDTQRSSAAIPSTTSAVTKEKTEDKKKSTAPSQAKLEQVDGKHSERKA